MVNDISRPCAMCWWNKGRGNRRPSLCITPTSCRVPGGSGNSDVYDVAKRGRPDNRMRSACVAKRLGDFGYALRHNETLSMVSETLSSHTIRRQRTRHHRFVIVACSCFFAVVSTWRGEFPRTCF